jgi:sigma 54 modulation protein/ribosomal protein S30EA
MVVLNMNKILEETIFEIKEKMGKELENIYVERVVFGLFFTGVKLSNGEGGLSYTPLKALSGAVCCPSQAAAMPNSDKLQGKNVSYFFERMKNDTALNKTLGIATINALASTCYKKGLLDYKVDINRDPFDNLDIKENSKTVVVGALVPYFKYLIKENKDFTILELDKTTLKGEELNHFVQSPSKEADEKVRDADYLVVTGTTLINDTIDHLLSLAKDDCEIVVVGPTVSMMPQAMFNRGVNHVGGVLVTDVDKVLDVIAEAGSGYHFFGKYAEKISISK